MISEAIWREIRNNPTMRQLFDDEQWHAFFEQLPNMVYGQWHDLGYLSEIVQHIFQYKDSKGDQVRAKDVISDFDAHNSVPPYSFYGLKNSPYYNDANILRRMLVPRNVGAYAFANNDLIEKVQINSESMSDKGVISVGAFQNCGDLRTLAFASFSNIQFAGKSVADNKQVIYIRFQNVDFAGDGVNIFIYPTAFQNSTIVFLPMQEYQGNMKVHFYSSEDLINCDVSAFINNYRNRTVWLRNDSGKWRQVK